MRDRISIFWFRQDLRIADNPGLTQAALEGRVLPIYIFDDTNPQENILGAASKWWTHHSLASLNTSLGHQLNFYKGDPETIIDTLVTRHKARAVYWNRCYEPWRTKRDTRLKQQCQEKGLHVESFNGSLLWEPWTVLKSDGNPYKVFTPFYRKGCLGAPAPRLPLGPPANLRCVKDDQSIPLDDLMFLPRISWDKTLETHWDISEYGARARLGEFLENGLLGYQQGRDFPRKPHASRLSAYLHSGEISPHQVWHAVRLQGESMDSDTFCTQLGWREFSYSLLYHFPALPDKNWQKKFDAFPWQDNPEALGLWQKGATGYPLVDAGMRELWQTGYMHNRVRMIVASFLIKNLLIDWREGARWFWDCLVDADLANNSASWQWAAGSGADAAPYFRIFNPISQGEKFDHDGFYTRKYVPELAQLPDKYLFRPWQAPHDVLTKAGVFLGKTYPFPIVDLPFSRARALEAFATTRLCESL